MMTQRSIGRLWFCLGVGSVATGATLLMLGLLKFWGITWISGWVYDALLVYIGVAGSDIALACKGYDRMMEPALS